MSDHPTPSAFSKFYQATAGRPPRELYRQTVIRFEQPGFAVDLGCGAGIETADLLERGWRVLAVDGQAEAIDLLRARVGPEFQERLETRVAHFAILELPPADFIWAGLSLPFCPPEHFDAVWSRIMAALRPGGRFAGDLFGIRHAWAGRSGITVHSSDAVRRLCQPLRLEYFIEEEGERQTVAEGVQHWHGFGIVARKG